MSDRYPCSTSKFKLGPENQMNTKCLPVSLLRSSFGPSQPDRLAILDNIQQAEAGVASLDCELEMLQDVVRDLHFRRQELQAFASHQRSFLTSIRKLPPELLGEIFQFCLDGHPISVCGTHSIWNLLHVCAVWRSVALSHHRLWSNIHIDMLSRFSPKGSISIDTILKRLRFCMEASDPHPLTISVTSLPSHSSGSLLVIEELVSNSNRWAKLSINHTSCLRLPGVKKNLRNLRSLTLYWCRFGNGGAHNFAEAPSLTHVQLINPRDQISDISIPWNQILSLHLGEVSLTPAALVCILRCTPKIETLQFDGQLTGAPPTHLILPNLRTLKLAVHLDGVCDVLQALTLPSLSDVELFTVFVEERSYDRYVESLLSLFQRSSCSIKTLSLREIPAIFTSKILKEASSIESLKLVDMQVTRDLIDLLVHSESRPDWLPKLKDLSFAYCKVDIRDIIDIVTSRCPFSIPHNTHRKLRNHPGGLRLLEFGFNTYNKPQQSDLARLNSLALDAGLEVQLL